MLVFQQIYVIGILRRLTRQIITCCKKKFVIRFLCLRENYKPD
jgi:hypothetical protein